MSLAEREASRGLSIPDSLPSGCFRRLVDRVLRSVVGPRDDRRVAAGPGCASTRIEVDLRGLFVVLLFHVHAPHVVLRAARDVLGRQHRGVHRVILVVVAMHSVPPYRIPVSYTHLRAHETP